MDNVKMSEREMINRIYYKNNLILKYSIKYPWIEMKRHNPFIMQLNRYYRKLALDFKSYCEKTLYKSAVEIYNENINTGGVIYTFEAYVTYTATYNQNGLLSIYFDQYQYTGGAHGATVRYSDNWDIGDAREIWLCEFYGNNKKCGLFVLNEIERQIEDQIRQGAVYFDNYRSLLYKTFNPANFYLVSNAITVFFQEYDIAPYVAGIKEFVIPCQT